MLQEPFASFGFSPKTFGPILAQRCSHEAGPGPCRESQGSLEGRRGCRIPGIACSQLHKPGRLGGMVGFCQVVISGS